MCHMYIAVDSVEVKIEADDNDVTECQHDVMPSTGMFAVSNDIFSAVYILFSVTFIHCLPDWMKVSACGLPGCY